jgi:hypothetical protein
MIETLRSAHFLSQIDFRTIRAISGLRCSFRTLRPVSLSTIARTVLYCHNNDYGMDTMVVSLIAHLYM